MSKEKIITITSKGQISIPKEIRQKLNLKDGAKLKVVVDGEEIILKPVTFADEFEDLILADLVKEGYEGKSLEMKLMERKETVEYSFEKLIKERTKEETISLEESDIFADLDEDDV